MNSTRQCFFIVFFLPISYRGKAGKSLKKFLCNNAWVSCATSTCSQKIVLLILRSKYIFPVEIKYSNSWLPNVLSGIYHISVDLFRSYVSLKDILQFYAASNPLFHIWNGTPLLRMLGIWASVHFSLFNWVFLRRLHTVSLFGIGFGRVISNKQNGGD